MEGLFLFARQVSPYFASKVMLNTLHNSVHNVIKYILEGEKDGS